MLCANDEVQEAVIGDAKTQSIHEIWHGAPMEKARQLHREHRGHHEIEPCRKCYLPRRTEPTLIQIGKRSVSVDNYVNRAQKIGS